MMTRRLCSFCLLLVIIAGLLTTVVVFAPGYMSPDSVDQLAQGRSGRYGDWHPPVMSWLWGRLDHAVPGPLGMLVFHNLLFWSGLGLWVALVAPRWNLIVKCLLLLVIGFFPPIFLLLSTILGRSRLALNRSAILAVSASALIYGLGYVVTSTSCDFRMEYWIVVAALVCSLAAVAALYPGWQTIEGPAP